MSARLSPPADIGLLQSVYEVIQKPLPQRSEEAGLCRDTLLPPDYFFGAFFFIHTQADASRNLLSVGRTLPIPRLSKEEGLNFVVL